MKRRIVSVLLRVYPAGWRQEYGPELRDLLERLDFRFGTVANVVWNGMRQRLRATEPWLLIGLPIMLLTTFVYGVLIVAPPPYDPMSPGLARSAVSIISLAVFVSLPVGCGLWTVVRNGGTMSHAGRQTLKMALLIEAPSFVVYALILTGTLGVIAVGPGDAPTTILEHGFAITVGSPNGVLPNFGDLALFGGLAVLLRWFLGFVGGAFGSNVAAAMRKAR
jgi:hypothetical protein